MNFFDSLVILLGETGRCDGICFVRREKRSFSGSDEGERREGGGLFTFEVESILHFSCGMLLRNEEGIEAPER